MKLIADSGSTKTDWCLIQESGKDLLHFTTQGLNPFHQSSEKISTILSQEVLPILYNSLQNENPNYIQSSNSKKIFSPKDIKTIYFYGAGCTIEKSPIIYTALQNIFYHATTIEVASDLLGAARSLCGHHPGIVCILGTGSNSCYYDGIQITQNVPPLGYILGDEGSGAVLGRRLISDCLKQQLPKEICNKFLTYCQLSVPEIIDNVYRQPMPSRFLAECSRFLYINRKEASIHQLLIECFNDFIRRNILSYPTATLFFIGSVAYYYSEELREAVESFGLSIATIKQRPMDGLITYHTKI